MTPQGAAPHRDRTDWIWLLLPYAMLLLTSAYAGFTGQVGAAQAPRTIVVGLALVAWHTFWAIGHRHWLERALVPMAVYFVGLVALCALLLEISPSYLPMYLVCYAIAFVALPGVWAYAGLILAASVPVALTGALGWQEPNLAVNLGGLALAGVIGWSIRKSEAETAARTAALTELARAHEDLERASAENVALQDRLVTEARESGVLAERTRLAAEIHDTLAAALSGIVSQLEALDAELAPEDPIRGRVRLSTDLARENLREARLSIQALRPTALHHQYLHLALTELTEAFERAHGLTTRVHVTGTVVDTPRDVEDALVRITREALTNIHRHAGAGRVHLTLSYFGDSIALDIADDGDGFGDPNPRGYGLQIMTERAQGVGGAVQVRTDPDTGTTVTTTVPLPGRTGAP
ncbi:sensor histidine kinase [Pseudactinotalea sp. Z1732]|uniref:sensor histidine kinase n=1 Tax=Pseudactinotalea sp. Z1732 TaxID=3413026 RepID=UPI003C7C1866